jgi:hypothetical protein
MQPADEPGGRVGRLRNKDGMLGSRLQLPQPRCNLSRRGRISQLTGELRDPLNIAAPRFANFYSGSIHVAQPILKRLVAIQENCDRTLIDQLHGHHRLKNTRGYGNPKRAQRFVEFLI